MFYNLIKVLFTNFSAPMYWEPLKTCNEDTCVNGECVKTNGISQLEEKFPEGTYCKCKDGYWGDNHCSLSK